MLSHLWHMLVGPPIETQQAPQEHLNKVRGLATFSPDALSSIAYANQEIFQGLAVAGAAGLMLIWPIGLAITLLLFIVAISYYQTIHGYPSGGGAYTVSRENLGRIPSLVAAAALLIDYLLTAAVSLTAGVAAISSAFPGLWPYRVEISLALLLLLTLLNLRGLRETGTIMAIPVYLFLLTYLPMLAYGLVRVLAQGMQPPSAIAPAPTEPLTLLIVLHTFSAGCTALTGIEAISNGVPAFRHPQAENAGKTLLVMALIMGILFLGSTGLIQFLAIIPAPNETILSALARRLLGNSFAYLLIQISTLLILTVAANTSFAGFPRLTAILAKDQFMPRQLVNLGDRLVYSNGIILLSAASGILIILFKADTHALIPLFAVGAFLAFTLSQSGMVVHWWRTRGKGWPVKFLLNGVGAVATGLTTLIIGINKFTEGAWISVFAVSILVLCFFKIQNHYQNVAQQLSLTGLPPALRPLPAPRVVIPLSGVHRGIVGAINFAQTFAREVTAVFVEIEPGSGKYIQETWKHLWPDIPLVILPSPYRSIIGPLIDFLDETDRQHNDGTQAVVVLPEYIPARWWQNVLHNQTALLIKNALLYRRRRMGFQRVIIDVPYHLYR